MICIYIEKGLVYQRMCTLFDFKLGENSFFVPTFWAIFHFGPQFFEAPILVLEIIINLVLTVILLI